MAVIRRTLFENPTLQIGLFEARPVSDACGEVERQRADVVVLPVSGVFAKHDGPARRVIGTPGHAVLVAADTPYRTSFPGAIGDRALTFRFDASLAPQERDEATAISHGLLPAHAMMLRNLLWRRLQSCDADPFETEARALDLVDLSLRSMRAGVAPERRATLLRRTRALGRVKEAIAVAPSNKWSVAKLGHIAGLSPFHLCHVFREMVGTSIGDYVLHARLAGALGAVLDGGDLTAIALDAGFNSHSHFTARFRGFFGCTPAALRKMATTGEVAQLRKIVTARLN